MKIIKIPQKIKKALQHSIAQYPQITNIIAALAQAGGRIFLVGGAVRDLFLDFPIKDLDIEVHQLSYKDVEKILKKFGAVSEMGKAYGVLRLHGLDIDWSVPRSDTAGRKPKVIIDPYMSFKDAFSRRDLTINAMGIDLVTYELIDPFDGLNDLKKGILRAPDAQRFAEDPLRFYRVMQFISRFEMKPDASLNKICKKMDLSSVSTERIDEEFRKMLLKSKQPSLGIRWLVLLSRLKKLFPELGQLVGVQQDKKWHPEGDVFEHTMQSLDAAAQLAYPDDQQKLMCMYGALCHDLGKANTTKKEKGILHSYGHAEEGIEQTKKLLKRITRNKELVSGVCKLVRYHMMPMQLPEGKASLSAYKRLALKLAPETTLENLAQVALADKRGRNPKSHTPVRKKFKDITEFIKKACLAQVLTTVEQPILKGRDLLGIVPAGPELGELLKKAYAIQLEQGIKDKEVLKKKVLAKSASTK